MENLRWAQTQHAQIKLRRGEIFFSVKSAISEIGELDHGIGRFYFQAW